METSFKVVGKIEKVTDEVINTFNDLMNVNDIILVLRTNEDSVSIKITDINDISIIEETKINRSLKLLT
ncbi:hypothetical protein K0O13_07630 [Mammaliicoccus sciuri]|uniref:hypothetical protein n=1 Tax=Mammaliicoccus sciuri TaxID=1296 RepID=UPI001C62B290|nr:hypothetical protein [Mammaliicoccus sciuri]QYG29971.1 hypothetical protein K0O13_07630 [Mammaliicoccus sciuri]